MRRVMVFVWALCAACCALGASVEWGCFTMARSDTANPVIGYAGSAVNAGTSVSIGLARNGNVLTVSDDGGTWLCSFTTWVLATAEEVVRASMFEDTSRIFQTDDGSGISNPFTANANADSFYLAFKTLVWAEPDFGPPSFTDYGWVQIDVTDGYLSLANSALGLNGVEMIVGGGAAIPEPNSASMLILGFSFVLLGRPRKK